MSAFIPRLLESRILARLTADTRKIIILYGQRQVRKTTYSSMKHNASRI